MVIKSRSMKWAGHVTLMGEMRNADNLIGESEWKIRLERRRRRWEDNITEFIWLKMWSSGGFL
jgi:hypothetical protein